VQPAPGHLRPVLRGVYDVKRTPGALAIEWSGDGGHRIEAEALREAAHALRRCGKDATLAPGARAIYLAA
jgi:hypothetical protein